MSKLLTEIILRGSTDDNSAYVFQAEDVNGVAIFRLRNDSILNIGKNTGNLKIGFANGEDPTGTSNTGIGYASLQAILGGNANTALGASSLPLLTTGSQNTAIGEEALFFIATTDYNTGIGYRALYSATGTHNTGAGHRALFSNVGDANVAIGSAALYNALGSNNVGVGTNSGGSSTGSRNIFLGYGAGYNLVAVSDTFVVDNRIRANAAADLSDSLIYGNITNSPLTQTLRINGHTGINVSPTYTFHVKNIATNVNAFRVADSTNQYGIFVTEAGAGYTSIYNYVSDDEYVIKGFGASRRIKFETAVYPTILKTQDSASGWQLFSTPSGTSGETGYQHFNTGVITANAGFVSTHDILVGSTGSFTGRIYGLTVAKSGYLNTNADFYPAVFMDGNVGIGALTPSAARLQILQNTVSTGAKAISINFNTIGEAFFMDDNGLVEFMTQSGITVRGSNGIVNLVSNGGVNPYIAFKYNNGSSTSGNLSGDGLNMFLTVTSNFGIGSTYFNASEKLEVSGNIKLSSMSNKIIMNTYDILAMSQGAGSQNIIIGHSNTMNDASNGGGIVIGTGSTSTANGISIGLNSIINVGSEDGIALGRDARVFGGVIRGAAIGRQAFAQASGSWAIGNYCLATQDDTIILGNAQAGNKQDVGIAFATPSARLHVRGAGITSATFAFKAESSAGTELFQIRNDGLIRAAGLQAGNAGLVSGDLYVDTAANVLANGDYVVARKV